MDQSPTGKFRRPEQLRQQTGLGDSSRRRGSLWIVDSYPKNERVKEIQGASDVDTGALRACPYIASGFGGCASIHRSVLTAG